MSLNNDSTSQIKLTNSFKFSAIFRKSINLFTKFEIQLLVFVILLLLIAMLMRFVLCKMGYADINPLMKEQDCSAASFIPLHIFG